MPAIVETSSIWGLVREVNPETEGNYWKFLSPISARTKPGRVKTKYREV
jgi:hypothetical protein